MTRLFVSDVHLDTAAPRAIEQFLDFLATRAAGTEALYILGDLFETWIGDDDRDAAKRSGLFRPPWQPGFSPRAGLLHADRLPAAAGPDRRRARRRARPHHPRRCAVHRRPSVPGAAQYRALAPVAASVPRVTAGR